MPAWILWILKYAPELISLVIEWLKNHKTNPPANTTLSAEDHAAIDAAIIKLEAAKAALTA